MYFSIHSRGNIFSQVFGRNKVNDLAQWAFFVPYLLNILVDFSGVEGLHVFENSQREREREREIDL